MSKVKFLKKSVFALFALCAFIFGGCTHSNGGGGTSEPEVEPTEPTVPSIVLDSSAVEILDAVPLVSSKTVKASVENASGAEITWTTTGGNAFDFVDNKNGYADLTAFLGGNGKITASIVVDEKEYSASAEVSVKLAESESADFSLAETEGETSCDTFKLNWKNSDDSLSVKSYIALLYKTDSENNTETLVSAEKLSASVTEKEFTNLYALTDYSVKLYCIYERSAEDGSSSSAYSVNSIDVKTLSDDSAPLGVTVDSSKTVATESSLTLFWTNPSDEDLAKINVNIFKGSDFYKLVELTDSEYLAANAELSYEFTDFEKYSEDCEYTFVFSTVDRNSNTDSKNDVSVTAKTLADSSPAEKISGLKLEITSLSESSVNLTANWTNPSDEDFAKVKIICGEEILKDSVTQNSASFTAVPGSDIKFVTVDSVGKENALGVTLPVLANFASSSGMKAQVQYTGQYALSGWTNASSEVSGTLYAFKAISSNDEVCTEFKYSSESEKAVISGLKIGVEYKIVIGTKFTLDTDCEGESAQVLFWNTDSAFTPDEVPHKIVWELHNAWNGNGFIVPYITNTEIKGYNLVLVGNADTTYSDISDFKYSGFIVWPGFDGDEDSFTLEATVASTGDESGLYVFAGAFNAKSPREWDITGHKNDWGYAYNYTFYLFVTDTYDSSSATDSEKQKMSFKSETSLRASTEDTAANKAPSNSTGWMHLTNDGYSGAYVWSKIANICGSSTASDISNNDYYDSSFFAYVHEFTGNETSVPAAEFSVDSTLEHEAVISYVLSAPNISSVTYSLNETAFDGSEISGEFKAPRGIYDGKISLSKLKSSTAYTLTLTQKTSSGLEKPDTVDFTTAADSTAPAAAQNLTATPGRTSVALRWTDPCDADLKEIHLYQGDSTTYTAVAAGTEEFTVTNLTANSSYTFSIKASDYDGNESGALSTECSTSAPAVSDVTATVSASFAAKVTWTDTQAVEYDANGNQITYSYKVTAYPADTSKSKIVKEVASGTEYAIFIFDSDEFGSKYTFSVTVVCSDGEEFESEKTEDFTVSKMLWRIRNGHYPNEARYMTPTILTEDVTVHDYTLTSDAHVCLTNSNQTEGAGSGSNYYCDYSYIKYTHWLVVPALDEQEGSISLMASNSSGELSDYYLYLDEGTTRNVLSRTECYQAAWWTTEEIISAIENKAFVATTDGSDNSGTPWFTDNTRASFTVSESTNTTTVDGFSSAKNFKADCGLYLTDFEGHTQFAGTSSIDKKYSIFWYLEEIISE